MKKLIAICAALAIGMAAWAQQALGPGTGLVSPEINPDHSVTFRLFAPKAIKVQVTGDFMPGSADMKEGKDGVWTFTTKPLEGELYSYSFIVDGMRTMDPSNIYRNRDVATWTNIFTLSAEQGDKGWYYEAHDVPHGTVSHVWYDSPTLGTNRRLTVYTPAGYEGGKAKYLNQAGVYALLSICQWCSTFPVDDEEKMKEIQIAFLNLYQTKRN